MNAPCYLIAARIGRTQGVDGWLRWYSNLEDAHILRARSSWLIRQRQHQASLKVTGIRTHHGYNLVLFDGCNDCDQAAKWTNAQVLLERQDLPKPEHGSYYWSDLIGFRVYNRENDDYGHLESFLATGANDVMVIKGSKERLIPWLDNVIVFVDESKKHVIVDWPAHFD